MYLGELQWAMMGSQEYNKIPLEDPNTPLKWKQMSDIVIVNEHGDFVPKGAKNKNAAMLLMYTLITKEGRAATAKLGYNYHLDPNSPEYEMIAVSKSLGAKIQIPPRDPEYTKWLYTKEGQDFYNKAELIIKTRGK
jgi:hypothetical protein